MYVIDFERLEAGDIVLTSVKGITSKAIRLATNSDYSHVMLYVGSGIYVHADQKGVNQGNIRRLTFKSKENVRVWRISDKSVRRDACIYARMQSGKKYSVLDAIKTKLPKILSIKNTNRQFCSRLVAQAYEKAGIRIVGDSNNCTPHDIDVSEHTTEVLGCMRRPSVEEEQLQGTENPVDRQLRIQNSMLHEIRKITGSDLQTIEQLTGFLVLNKHFDERVTEVIKESGYLYFHKDEVRDNPWRYDKHIFLSMNVDSEYKKKLARELIPLAENQLSIFEPNAEYYGKLAQESGLIFAKTFQLLYERLVDQAQKSIISAEYVLSKS